MTRLTVRLVVSSWCVFLVVGLGDMHQRQNRQPLYSFQAKQPVVTLNIDVATRICFPHSLSPGWKGRVTVH